MREYLNKMEEELRLRKYSRRTRKIYLCCVGKYFEFLGGSFGEFSEEKMKEFLLIKEKTGVSGATLNLYLNAVKFFYKQVMNGEFLSRIKLAKRPKKLPVVLSREEVLRIIDSIGNKKHRLMVALAYGAGLRVSEVVAIRKCDVDLPRGLLHVKGGKGDKDRVTVFPEKLVNDIGYIMAVKDKNDYLFESERGGRLCARSLQKVFEMALLRADVMKNATFHSLRHSFATHLLEDGVSIRYIQELLGHSSIKTTEVYTMVTSPAIMKIRSPL